MWRCKKCGGEIIAKVELLNDEYRLQKNGNVKIPKREILIDRYYCLSCDRIAEDCEELQDIAEWEEE